MTSYWALNPFKMSFAEPAMFKYLVVSQFDKIIKYKPGQGISPYKKRKFTSYGWKYDIVNNY